MRTILSCVLVFVFFLCLGSDLVAEPKTTPISITQLRKELIGVGDDPVMEKFLHVPGPDVFLNPGEGLRWIYKLECFDPGSGKTYPEVEVHFKIGGLMDGKVDYVRPWDTSWDKFFNERAPRPIKDWDNKLRGMDSSLVKERFGAPASVWQTPTKRHEHWLYQYPCFDPNPPHKIIPAIEVVFFRSNFAWEVCWVIPSHTKQEK